MFDSDCTRSGGSIWGIVIFFLILFWVFMGGNGGFFGRNGWGPNGWNGSWGLNEHTPKDNSRELSDLKCTMDKDTAVLQGQLDTAFRTVMNNDNVNTAAILSGQKDLYIKQLEQQATQLFITGQNDQTRFLMQMFNAEQNRRLDSIEANMLRRPPVYPTVCVPCSSNCCGSSSGCGCGSFA